MPSKFPYHVDILGGLLPAFVELRLLAPCRRHVLHSYAPGFKKRRFIELTHAANWFVQYCETEARGFVWLTHISFIFEVACPAELC